MKRRRRKQREDEEAVEDALTSLGMGSNRYLVEDDAESVREKLEARITAALHWSNE